MSTMPIRKNAKDAIDKAIAAGNQPKSNKAGFGLVLSIPGARHRALFNEQGITAIGKYYYTKTGLPPPGTFDYNQDAIRKNRSQFITLLDGTQKKISTWDNVIESGG